MSVPVFRFAPSPNGHLHLGHAFSAMLNFEAAKETGGRFLLRLEDIDTARCTSALERDLLEDLRWLGLDWEEPVLRQSRHFEDYGLALKTLNDLGLTYRAYLTRAEVKRYVGEQEDAGTNWPRDPDGAPLYPGDRAVLSEDQRRTREVSGLPFAIRLDMRAALEFVGRPLTWCECGANVSKCAASARYENQTVDADPACWGDVILARKDTPTSYHISVVVDDARQGITDAMRGMDLYHATSVQRLLQTLLCLPEPRYHHHRLLLAKDGRKLSKSDHDTSLRELRIQGASPLDIRRRVAHVMNSQMLT